jgi:hypothetical protein
MTPQEQQKEEREQRERKDREPFKRTRPSYASVEADA